MRAERAALKFWRHTALVPPSTFCSQGTEIIASVPSYGMCHRSYVGALFAFTQEEEETQ